MKVKYLSRPFAKLSGVEVGLMVKRLLINLHVITGWDFPAEEFHDALSAQLAKKMQENYGNCNTDEVEFAARKYSHLVENWGKSLNLTLLDRVMLPYLESRRQLSDFEEKKAVAEPAAELPPQKTDDASLISQGRNVYLFYAKQYGKDDPKRWMLIPQDTYYALERQKLIAPTLDEKKKIYTKALGMLRRIMSEDYTFCPEENVKPTAQGWARKIVCYEFFEKESVEQVAQKNK